MVGSFRAGLIDRMNELQRHRGPDGLGTYERPDRRVALGHARLSILDLSDSAAQPMVSRDGEDVLVFNGEIYNFRGLRDRLIGLGHTFSSSGDTEVLLNALRQWGEDAIAQLNGMFAFAWWNAPSGRLLIGRDRIGIKPLYYSVLNDGALIFGSEIKSLLAHPSLDAEVCFDTLQQHMAFGHAFDTGTIFRRVKRLAPGGVLRYRVDRQELETGRFWEMPIIGDAAGQDSQSGRGEILARAVRDSVVEQMVSDVPVGAFLSGGLDSSLITAVAAAEVDGMRSYACGYSEQANQLDSRGDDLPYAREVAASLRLDHREIMMQSDCIEMLSRLLYHLDEPLVDPAIFCCYEICKRAREDGVPVLLSGQGADELFAGYPRYFVMQATAWMDRLPLAVRRSISATASLLPGAMSGRVGGMSRRVRRVLTGLGVPPEVRFAQLCAATPDGEINQVLSRHVKDELRGRGACDASVRWMRNCGHDGVERYLQRDIAHYLPNHNLLYTDKMGMAVGIEARVPLLDNRLVSLASEIPLNAKTTAKETKIPLRRATEGIVPSSVLNRSKAGFGLPYRGWLRNELADLWDDVSSEESVNRRGWFDYESVKTARVDAQEGRRDTYMLQWALLTLEIWARRFLDRRAEFISTN